jgi:hypothetical protein
MHLLNLPLPKNERAVPDDVRRFVREAERHIARFQASCRFTGFVASNFEGAYGVLQALAVAQLAPGSRFCEWGSGFGLVASLATMLDFDACGIEINRELVDAAQALADDFDLPAEFIHGSFIPRGGDVYIDAAYVRSGDGFAWLSTDAGHALDELGQAPDDFDIIFAYPWPDEEDVIGDLFERCAAVGAILMTHHGGDEFRLRRKITGRRAAACSRRNSMRR